MRITVRNLAEAEEYVTGVIGDSDGEYSFAAGVDAHGVTPEVAYEDIGQSTYLEIQGLGEIGEGFGEHRFDLDPVKKNYADELGELTSAHEILKDHGLEHATEISVEREAESAYRAVCRLENTDILPVLKSEEDGLRSIVMYEPGETPLFEPRVQPTSTTTPEEAREREEELENILRELNIVE
ncbi:MAG: hypothetical protein ABEJ07_02590 [Candidatus Nanohaloarchaea archaeon]